MGRRWLPWTQPGHDAVERLPADDILERGQDVLAAVKKTVEGRLRKFTDDVVLLRQPFIMHPERTVGQALDAAAATAGAP